MAHHSPNDSTPATNAHDFASPEAQTLEPAIQRWFTQRGLTLLLMGTSLATSTTERAARVMVSLFVLTMLLIAPVWLSGNVIPSLGLGLVLTLVAWWGSNLLRRRRIFSVPRTIGWFEALAYLVMPSTVVLFTTDVGGLVGVGFEDPTALEIALALVVFCVQLLELALLLGMERLGLLTLASWLGRTFLASLGQTGSTLATTLPVSLGVVFFFFLNPSVWATMGTLSPVAYASVIGLLLILAGAFLGSQRHLGLASLSTFDTEKDYRDALATTPLADSPAIELPATCPMTPLQNFCVRQVAVLSQLVVGLVIACAVFMLFLVIGYLAVDPATVQVWTRAAPRILTQYHGTGHTYAITPGHLRVAGFLATFAAFNYSLASATDGRLRQNSKEQAADAIRSACAMRLALLRGALTRS